MKKVLCNYGKEKHFEYAYEISDFPFHELKAEINKKYISLPATFDIETTTIVPENKIENPFGYMYIWQMCIENKVVFGRTWNDWKKFLNKLIDIYELNEKKKLVIYVHNLSFEFQFIKDFIEFKNIFATDSHKVLKCSNDYFEFRCSYRLSNMNLKKFIENTPKSKHLKGVNDLDYKTIRTSETELTEIEYGYCFNDVLGLYEAILFLLKSDTLETIPLTSTGYVRRECRKNMRKNKKNHMQFVETKIDSDIYYLLKECFRGGNTASNRYLTNMVLEKVGSYDISSSYPYAMLLPIYPIGKFFPCSIEDIQELKEYNKNYCTIGKFIFENIRLKKNISIPYLPYSKCRNVLNSTCYNGRILKADFVETSITNLDFEIIEKQYEYDFLSVKDFYISRRDFLPQELRNSIFEYFETKSKLKGIKEKEYEYMQAKGKLNSIYGMCVTDIVHNEFKINDSGEWFHEEKNIDDELEKFYKNRNNFLSYQWGVFVSAYARKRLQIAIDKIGMDVVYCDTDSVKYIGVHDKDFEEINKNMLAYCKENTIKHSIKVNDKKFMMGQFDNENQKEKTYEYDLFKTLGAKKYAFKIGDEYGLTVAGLSKKLGGQELSKEKNLDGFRIGKVFKNSGRTTVYFNNEKIHEIEINGVKMITGSNIAILETTYTLGITDTMLSILERITEDE